METKITSPVVKGVIISLLLIVFGLTLMLTNQIMNQGLSSVQYIILIGGIILSCTTFSKQMNANVTFGKVFAHGFQIVAVIVVIMIVYSLLASYLFPEVFDEIMRATRQKLEAQGRSDAEIDTAIKFSTDHKTLLMTVSILFMFGIIGAISALIGAAVAKKKPQSPFDQQPV